MLKFLGRDKHPTAVLWKYVLSILGSYGVVYTPEYLMMTASSLEEVFWNLILPDCIRVLHATSRFISVVAVTVAISTVRTVRPACDESG